MLISRSLLKLILLRNAFTLFGLPYLLVFLVAQPFKHADGASNSCYY